MARLYTAEGYPFDVPDDVQELKDYADQISLPAQLPGYVHEPYKQNKLEKTIAVMTGQNGEERFQTWPEKMVRSAVTLPVDVMSGAVPTNFGLRRNDFTDIPGSAQPNEELINRTQDLAGLAAGSTLMPKPAATAREVLATMPKMNRMEAMQRQNLQGLQLAADAEAGTALAAVKNANPFYSVLENSLANISMKSGTKEQWTNAFKKYGTTADELAATGLNDLPSGQIARADIEKHIAENKVELKEVNRYSDNIEQHIGQLSKQLSDINTQLAKNIQKSDSAELALENQNLKNKRDELSKQVNELMNVPPTKYHKWQLPGGENYKEKLLTLPASSGKYKVQKNLHNMFEVVDEKGNLVKEAGTASGIFGSEANAINEARRLSNLDNTFTSSHWSEPNVLVHIRTNDRIIPASQLGGRNSDLNSLHIEEIQSDWHQKGRKEGYKVPKNQLEKLEKDFNVIDDKIVNSGDEAVMGNPDIKSAIKDAIDKKIITKEEAETYLKFVNAEKANISGVPDAPFKETSAWAGLAMKRLIRQAAEEGQAKEIANWDKIVHTDTDKIAHSLVKEGLLREICE